MAFSLYNPVVPCCRATKLQPEVKLSYRQHAAKAVWSGAQDLSSKKAEGAAQGDSYRKQLAEAHVANDVLHRQLETLEQEHHQLQRCAVLCDIDCQPSASWDMALCYTAPNCDTCMHGAQLLMMPVARTQGTVAWLQRPQ